MEFSCRKISDALRESLIDKGIVDRKTWEPTTDYFELDIKEGPVLGLAQKAYDMEGIFHVGCVADARPPSLYCGVQVGDSQTKRGRTNLGYRRDLRLKTFFGNNAFRKKSLVLERDVRDLEGVAKAFNEGKNYKETFGIYWNGWSGEQGSLFGKKAKFGFAGEAIELYLENGLCTEFSGINNVFENPKIRFNVPFQRLAKDTRLEDVAKLARDKVWAGRLLRPYDIAETEVKLEDLMTGILQVAEKVLPAKMPTKSLEQEIIEVCSGFSMAPKGYHTSSTD